MSTMTVEGRSALGRTFTRNVKTQDVKKVEVNNALDRFLNKVYEQNASEAKQHIMTMMNGSDNAKQLAAFKRIKSLTPAQYQESFQISGPQNNEMSGKFTLEIKLNPM